MHNKYVARALKHTAALIELTGGNAFRGRAYAGAARLVDGLEEPVVRLVEEGRLTGVPGIGGGLASDIEALVQTGSFEGLDELLATVPPGLLDVLRVKGLGPKKARVLWQELGVTSLDDLEERALTGQIAQLGGFGKKTEEKLLDGVRRLRTYLGKVHYATAVQAAGPVLAALREAPGVTRAEAAGGLRRRAEVLEAAEIVVAGDADALLDLLAREAEPADDLPEGAFFAGALPDGLPLVAYLAEPDAFDGVWWQRTGSEAHVTAFLERHGEAGGGTEGAIYERAGLAFIPPELREGDGEIEVAAQGALPRLVETGDLRGSLHNHSTYSDGAHTLREMADAARGMGYEYFGICDHSRSLKIANGLPIERLREQGEEVRALNSAFASDGGRPFRVLHGSEVDILQDGSLDYPDDVLAELDLVVASVHMHFGMTEAEATERLIRAVENPFTDILGHPTGRLLLRREGYPVDHEAVLQACAARSVAIELNANPYRLDMDWRYLRRATELGVPVAINPDAHSIDGLVDVQWGVAAARKGWLTAEGCLNALPLDAFLAWLEARRARAGVSSAA